MEKTKQNIGRLFAALVLITLVMTAGFAVALPSRVRDATGAFLKESTGASSTGAVEIAPGTERSFYVYQFSGNGFIENSNTASNTGEPVSIVAAKNRAIYPFVSADILEDSSVQADVAAALGISREEVAADVSSQAFVETSSGAFVATEVASRPTDLWRGLLTVSSGELQEKYFIIGKESNSEIKFAVIPLKDSTGEISKLVVAKSVYPKVEIWRGELDLSSDSNFKGEWKLTAFSNKPASGKILPVPLEIKKGSEAKISKYLIKSVDIRKGRVFGFIPIGKEYAVVQIYKDGTLIAEKKLSEDETAKFEDLVLKVVKINGQLKVVVEASGEAEVEED